MLASTRYFHRFLYGDGCPVLPQSVRGAFNGVSNSFIPLNRPGIVGRELEYIEQALRSDHRHGSGRFTTLCQTWIERWVGSGRAFLTQSCTAALEMAALLVGLGEGDEVIMPSYTFVSTANAFVLRGAVPVFVDIDPFTQNISPVEVESAITHKSRAIVVVHYGGVGGDMGALVDIASRNGLVLIEDAAQALMAYKTGRPLGSFGALATLSFHDSKNVSSGEGGALIVNDPVMARRAELLWEKGTNRSQFMRKEVDKYNWVDIGSSFLPSEVTAAFLLAQFEKAEETTRTRQKIWARYQNDLAPAANHPRLPNPPPDCEPNGHIFYLVLPTRIQRDAFIVGMKARNIATPFHYVPLHSSPAGQKFGRAAKSLPNTETAGNGLVRLPLFPTLSDVEYSRVVASTFATLSEVKVLP
jgi:dTDP-4-amino-4,6-dideoxygalactose transaminase